MVLTLPRGAMRAALLVLAAIALYDIWTWRSVTAFVTAFDHCELLFCDFVRHFYPMGAALFQMKEPVGGYFYSAFFAVLLSPFAAMPLPAALWIWGVAGVACAALLFSIPISEFVRGSARRAAIYTLAFVTSVPLLHGFKWGQVSVLVVLTMLGSLDLYRRGHHRWAGVVLALGASIKFYPGLCVVYYVLKRDTRVLIPFALTILIAGILVPAIALGPASWWHFEAMVVIAVREASASWIPADPNSQYFPHVVTRLLPVAGAASSIPRLLAVADIAVLVVNLLLVWRIVAARRPHETALCGTLLMLSTPFALTTSWPHYFVFLPFCTAVLLGIARAQPASWRRHVAVLLVLAGVGLSSLFALNAVGDWQTYSARGFVFWSDGLLLAATYLLVSLEPAASEG